MLEAIISHYTKGNKAKFAALLGVSAQTISAWGARNTFDTELIYTKCSDISADWLLTGKGFMLRADERPTNSVTPSTDAPAASAKPDESILYNMYKDLQAEKEKIRLEKESEIKELNAKMLAMSEEIGRLKAKLGEEEPEVETHPKGLGQKTAEDVSIKKRSSQSYPDAPSVGVPSGGR